jgi:hypothetical protein
VNCAQPAQQVAQPIPDAVEWYGGVKTDEEIDQQVAQQKLGIDSETKIMKLLGFIDDLIESDPDKAERFIESVLAKNALQKRLAAKKSNVVQPAPVQGEPVLFVSEGQLAAHTDAHPDHGAAGNYIPARKTPAGNFTTALYIHPQQASEPMTDELESVLEALVNRCNNDAGLTNDDAVIAAEAALERLYKSRAVERHHKIGGKQ